jgi:HK97 family phage major capsid protein
MTDKPEEMVIAFGGAVKALGDGKVGGYLVRFTSEDEPDLEGEFFTKDTDYGPHRTSPVYFQHGMDAKIGTQTFGTVELTEDDFGIWMEHQLDVQDKYQRAIYGMAEEGKMGLSSGTASHLVAREKVGKVTWLKKWPLGLDASYTQTPAEPQNAVIPLKSWQPPDGISEAFTEDGAQPSGDAVEDEGQLPVTYPAGSTGDNQNIGHLEVIKMEEQKITLDMAEYKGLLRDAVKAETGKDVEPDVVDPRDAKLEEMSTKLNDALDFIKNAPALKDANYVAPDSETDHAEAKSFGDFLVAVGNKNIKRLREVYKSGYVKTDADGEFKAALAEDAGATGGYLVPTQYEARLLEIAREQSVVRAAGATIIPMTGRQVQVPALDVETAPSAGNSAFLGGVVATWTAEAAAHTETEPEFRLIQMVAKKLSGYTLGSNEVTDDAAVSLEALLMRLFGDAIAWHEDYAFLNGTGVGEPKGILKSGALVSATARSAASAFAIADAAKMMAKFLPQSWRRGAWLIAPDLIEKLIGQVSNPLAWLENLRTSIPMVYLGKPLYVTEKLPAVNTVGDVLLVDCSYYLIGDRAGIAISSSEHYKFINDQMTWKFVKRVDGQPWIDNAITLQDASRTVSPFVALAAG